MCSLLESLKPNMGVDEHFGILNHMENLYNFAHVNWVAASWDTYA